MSEFSYGGGKLPHDPESTKEHLHEVAEAVRHEKAADEVVEAGARAKRRRWRFRRKRSV